MLRVSKGENNPRVAEALLGCRRRTRRWNTRAALDTAAEATNVAAMSGRSSRPTSARHRAVSLGPNDERVDAERTQRRISWTRWSRGRP